MDTTTPAETPEIKLHFLDYWRVIRLRRSLILTVFLLCLMSSAILSYSLPKQYLSKVVMEVQKDEPIVSVSTMGYQPNMGWDPYWLTTQFKIITAWDILCPVITNLNLQNVLAHQADDPAWSLDQTYKALYAKVDVEQTRGTSLIEISVKNPDWDLAANIANKIAETYKQYRLDAWQGSRSTGVEALDEQVKIAEAELTNRLAQLDEMREKSGIPDLDSTGTQQSTETIYSQTIRMLESRRIDAQVDYNDHSNILANLNGLREKNLLASALPTEFKGQLDPELFLLEERLHHAQDGLTETRELGYGTNHENYIKAQRALEEATNAYAAKIEGIMSGLEGTVAHDKGQLETIAQLEEQAKAKSYEEAKRTRPYFTMKRDVESFARNLEELKRLDTQQRVESLQPLHNTVIIHDPARADKRPVRSWYIYMIPGVLVGLIVGVGLAFFIEYLDTSVKTIDDVERALQAPVLGVIPQNVGNVIDEGAESPHAEAYRVLRTNLLFSRKDENWNTITVLSGGAGEGKTTTLINLATVFAQNGQRILVVDSDLRRPSAHRVLRLSNAIGLTDLLLNKQLTLEQVILKTKLPTLDFLPSGKLPSSSMSILASTQMKDIIRELKRRYDFVFFDSPPLLGVSDASVLASEMDMVIQVIQYRRYPTPMTLRAKQMIQKVGGNLMGLVLNNINMSQDEHYYYYSGYYEYDSYDSPSNKSDATVVQLSDAAAKASVEIKQKY